MKKIVIVGAGYAGLLTAKKLAKSFKNHQETQITLIDKNSYHTMLTELHEVAAARVDEDSIKVSLKKIFRGRNVDVVLDNVTDLDFDGKKVVAEGGNYDYDYLVLAAGSKPTYFGVLGAGEHGYNLWSYDDAIKLKERIEYCFRKASQVKDEGARRKLLTFYVVGAGFTGVEMAGELGEYAPFICKKFDINRDEVSIVNVDVLPRAVPILPEKLSAKVEKRLAKTGVTTAYGTGVVEIGKDYIVVKENGQDVKKDAGTVIWAAGIESAGVTTKAAERLVCKGRGRIATDEYLRAEGREDVFVVGDNMFFIPEGESVSVPQMVENCEQSAHTAAHNIVAAIKGGEQSRYKPSFHGVMVCVGGRYGVARVGFPKAMINLPSFFAMFVKHFINIIYFIQILGWNKVFSYLKHEFFTIRNERSFVGGHFSNRTPSFLLVPIRIWLGVIWVYEGVMKIVEGWLKEPKLEGFFGGARAWYDGILSGGGAGGGDAITAATGAASGGGEAAVSMGTKLLDFDIFGILRFMFVSGKELEASSVSDLAFRVKFSVTDWFIDKVVLSSESMQVFMQTSIVIAEIIIGLCLIGGLFTFLACSASLLLQIMFVMTTGLYVSTFWMIFAAIAVHIGAGSIFGLDYYVMPVLKRWWTGTKLGGKWYLYND